MAKDSVVKNIARWTFGEKGQKAQRVSLRSGDYYIRSFDWIVKLVSIAKKDFPKLKDSDIEIVVYSGSYIKGFTGIEFDPGEWDVPLSYQSVTELEPKA